MSAHERKYRKVFNKKNPKVAMINRARSRAKSRGLPFNITTKDFEIPEFCPVLGIRMEQGGGIGERNNSPSLDRIIQELGYTRGNIEVISYRANRIKGDSNVAELIRVADYYKRKYNME